MKQTDQESDGKWFRVSLRLMGDNLPVDEIEDRLSIEPLVSAKKGEHIDGNPKYAKYDTNFWVWSSWEDSDVPFEPQINEMLEVLELKHQELNEILSLPDVKGELFLGFSSTNGQGGAYLSNALLQRVVKLGLALHLDLYPPSE